MTACTDETCAVSSSINVAIQVLDQEGITNDYEGLPVGGMRSEIT